jgi:hypothetical protein
VHELERVDLEVGLEGKAKEKGERKKGILFAYC